MFLQINEFIHCFVGVRQITSLYDLEEAICKSEGIEKFEELELGPFLRQPLISHYFLVKSDVNKVFKIATDDVIVCLSEYTDTHKAKDIKVDEFLDFIAKKRSLASKEQLGVRIQNLGYVFMSCCVVLIENVFFSSRDDLLEKLKNYTNP